MIFRGRKREIAAINSELGKEKNIILTGKFGIGKTTLVKKISQIAGERWLFLFSDFSETPSKVCQDLLKALKPKRSVRDRKKYIDYKKCRSMISEIVSKSERQCVIVLDNIEKLTPRKLDLIRYWEWKRSCLFIAIPEHFLSKEDINQLRICLYPSRVINLRYISAEQTRRFFQDCAARYQLQWTESDIHMLSLASKGYPLGMKEFVMRELKTQKEI